jgi:uncharacterized damage-inducible protein DinB
MPKADLIADLQAARARLLDALDGLTEDQMMRPGAVGIWSIKDTLGHLVAWEAEVVTVLSRLDLYRRRTPKIMEIEDIDEWHEKQYHVNARRSLRAVLDDFHGVHTHLIQAIEALDNRTLDDNRRFPWMEGEPLSYLVMENAAWHEEEHAEDIEQWRAEENL